MEEVIISVHYTQRLGCKRQFVICAGNKPVLICVNKKKSDCIYILQSGKVPETTLLSNPEIGRVMKIRKQILSGGKVK